MILLENIFTIALEVAPWLLVGLGIAGAIKGLIPDTKLASWLGGTGFAPIARGAVIGAPLPLCSCGAIPAGVALHRSGASRGATMAFMVGTPGIGIDSIALTYALMGPFMAVARAMSAVAGAIIVGLSVATSPSQPLGLSQKPASGCCNEPSCQSAAPDVRDPRPVPAVRRVADGLRYAFHDVLRDIAPWMAIGIVVAGALATWIPPEAFVTYGNGWGAMIFMAFIGIPIYLCAQAATPIAAGMIVAGLSPGVALVFLLAAPMTSLATLAVLRREFGLIPTAVFVAAIAISSIISGLAVEGLVSLFELNIVGQVAEAGETLPSPVAYLALATLAFFTVLSWMRKRATLSSSIV